MFWLPQALVLLVLQLGHGQIHVTKNEENPIELSDFSRSPKFNLTISSASDTSQHSANKGTVQCLFYIKGSRFFRNNSSGRHSVQMQAAMK